MILITFYLVLMLQKLEFCKFFALEKFRMLQQTFIAVLTALMAQKAESRPFKTNVLQHCTVETIQDFLIKLGIKPSLHTLEISIFSLNNVIIRPTKIMNNLLKDCKIRTFKVIFQHQKSMKSF